jgi:hypothetical protein
MAAFALIALAACTEGSDRPTPTNGGYYVRFFGEPRLLDTRQPYPEAQVVASTNLPEGTLVIVTYTEGESMGITVAPR